jgi:GDP-D-mannose dehydratase
MIDVSDKEGRVLLEVDKEFYRLGEVPYLRGSYKKIENALGWNPSI